MGAIRSRIIATLAVALIASPPLLARQHADDAVIVQFQRAADSYAFQHRQAERRGAAAVPQVEGAFFTPQVAAVLRNQIRTAGCESPRQGAGDFVVPRINGSSEGTSPLPACLSAALPKLPPELEYRVAGVTMLLVDAHLHIVIDVMHAAFPHGAVAR